MRKYKKLPQVLADEYELSAAIDKKKYKLTEESQLFRDKIADFVINKVRKEIKLT
jgi:hypothetical protein